METRDLQKRKRWLIACVVSVLIVDYATILRIEIFDEIGNGRTALEAVTQGNLLLTFLGIIISVLGVALILYLLLNKGNEQTSL